MKLWAKLTARVPSVSGADNTPPEIWHKIIGHLGPFEQAQVRAVSRLMRSLVEGECERALSEQFPLLPLDMQDKLRDASKSRRASIALRYHDSFVPAPWAPLGWVADAHLVRAPWGRYRPKWQHDVIKKPRDTLLACLRGWRPSGWLAACADQRARRRRYAKALEALTPLRPPNELSLGSVGIRSDAMRLSILMPHSAGRPILSADSGAMVDDSWPNGARLLGYVWDVTRPYVLGLVVAEPTYEGPPNLFYGVWEARYPMARENLTSQPGALYSHICLDAGRVPLSYNWPTRAALRVMPDRIEVLLAAADDGDIDQFSLSMPVSLLLSPDMAMPEPGTSREDHPLRGRVQELIPWAW